MNDLDETIGAGVSAALIAAAKSEAGITGKFDIFGVSLCKLVFADPSSGQEGNIANCITKCNSFFNYLSN
jgi:hypothetical protein